MGKRPAGVELFEGNMASMQWEIRPSIQRDGTPTMETGLERIAERARCEPKLRFTSLAHHITEDRVWKSLCQIPSHSAPGVDGQGVSEAKERFEGWIGVMMQSIHRKGYRAPDIRRVYIPKPGKQEKRPLGVPTVSDRALQRSTSQVLSAVYEQDFLPCSFGGRPGLGAHHALASLTEVIAGSKVGWVLEADLKNFFGSLDHDWLLQFVRHRIGDPRLISLIGRWLKAGVLEDGVVTPSETGTPQGGSISVLLSNVYLHYVLDLWFERVAKPRLRGEACLVRYIDDFVVCFQYREDALRLEDALRNRLERFGLTLEPTKTKLVEFGRFAQRHAGKHGRMRWPPKTGQVAKRESPLGSGRLAGGETCRILGRSTVLSSRRRWRWRRSGRKVRSPNFRAGSVCMPARFTHGRRRCWTERRRCSRQTGPRPMVATRRPRLSWHRYMRRSVS